ncbi:MAG: hypothetical protein JNK46_17845 [Methylobacteriaceae bacterium]|nr:hypothetical protein [Methylobacteriaceae bacterium]
MSQEETAILCAGARARGMADAFSLLGLPAVFIGPRGEVLHVGAEAAPLFGRAVAVDERRLVAGAAGAGLRLEEALRAAMAEGAEATVPLATGQASLFAHVIPVPASPGQLLCAVVLLLESPDRAAAGLAAAAVARLAPRDSGPFLSH